MLHPGLVSVTFRKLTIPEIVGLVADTGLEGIEWGGDIHVPPGDWSAARLARDQTLDIGAKVASYGSYYRLGTGETPFERILETALALGAPNIRIWAGTRGSSEADEACWQNIVSEAGQIASLAEQAGITVSFEYHSQTLTDTLDSTLRLLKAISHPNVFTYWQVPDSLLPEEKRDGLKNLLPWLSNLHVYQWSGTEERRPLAEGRLEWSTYLQVLRSSQRKHNLLLEFVQDDSPSAFRRDAETLTSWLGQLDQAV